MTRILLAVVVVLIVLFAVMYIYYPEKIPFLQLPKQKKGYPAGLVENEVVRDPKTGRIYRLEKGTKRWFPNPAIFTKHEPSKKYIDIDADILAQIPNGADFI